MIIQLIWLKDKKKKKSKIDYLPFEKNKVLHYTILNPGP